ncbi:hypothetical protein [Komagataeibacter swingsii]|uniref:Uncharacterized protein n=2 Tax=Komagataeibacter swingsii TaxID=215220 RepID=A0A2V4S9A7_9PROT|nr:hypothetical protein [Komagataeibacter swingsii]PYD68588.1 hypothetical protein CFR76_14205 [Komagataeibacter swingsii]GBQ57783.1 hypothetical protein AA16373_1093 [Komagataeibacter swingsii DSM 16373]
MKLFPKSFEKRRVFENRRHPEIPILVYQAIMVLIFPAMAMAADTTPADVTAFIHDAQICQYLAGEWDSTLPDARRLDLAEETGARCATIDVRQKSLRRKYRHNKTLLAKNKHL